MIRPEQVYAPDMCLSFSLVRNDVKEEVEEKCKFDRVFVIDAPKQWQEPVMFSIAFNQVIQETLHVLARNDSDPSAPRDRQVLERFAFFYLRFNRYCSLF